MVGRSSRLHNASSYKRPLVSDLSSSLYNSVGLGDPTLVRVWRRNHPRHLCVTVEQSLLRHIVSSEIWLELDRQLNRAQVGFRSLNDPLSFLVVELACDLGVEWFDGDSLGVASDMLSSSLFNAVKATVVHVLPTRIKHSKS